MPPRGLAFVPLDAADVEPARLGGDALLGGVADWPAGLDGQPLALLLSLPAAFIAQCTGIAMERGQMVSVFTTYAPGSYYLDQITYHGDASELALLRKGATQVLVHPRGTPVRVGSPLAPYQLRIEDDGLRVGSTFASGAPEFLQAEPLALEGLAFALQIYAGDLPPAWRDIFYLRDAVAYLFIPLQALPGVDRSGLLFTQVT